MLFLSFFNLRLVPGSWFHSLVRTNPHRFNPKDPASSATRRSARNKCALSTFPLGHPSETVDYSHFDLLLGLGEGGIEGFESASEVSFSTRHRNTRRPWSREVSHWWQHTLVSGRTTFESGCASQNRQIFWGGCSKSFSPNLNAFSGFWFPQQKRAGPRRARTHPEPDSGLGCSGRRPLRSPSRRGSSKASESETRGAVDVSATLFFGLSDEDVGPSKWSMGCFLIDPTGGGDFLGLFFGIV